LQDLHEAAENATSLIGKMLTLGREILDAPMEVSEESLVLDWMDQRNQLFCQLKTLNPLLERLKAHDSSRSSAEEQKILADIRSLIQQLIQQNAQVEPVLKQHLALVKEHMEQTDKVRQASRLYVSSAPLRTIARGLRFDESQ